MNALAAPSVLLLATVAIAQWSTPVPVASLNSVANDGRVMPMADGLTIYFASNRTGNLEIFTATRAARYGVFGPPTQVLELSNPATDAAPCARFDNLELFFQTNRAGGGGLMDLWRADRPSTSVPFNAPVPVTELNSTADEIAPTLTLDGLRIYFASNRLGNHDIWTATRPSWTSAFATPSLVTELSTTGQEYGSCISAEGLVIFFSSNRPGGLGGDDIWMASRLDTASPFGNIVNVTALNSWANEVGPGRALFHDEIFFVSDRTSNRTQDIYTARFTGLVSTGIAGVSSSMDLRFSGPSSAGKTYVAASSLGSSPGIPIDTRVLPLNWDPLLQLSVGGLPPVLTGFVGTLDQDGTAAGRISFAGLPYMVGFRFFTAFVVLDPAATSGIKTISNALEVKVQ